MFASLNLLSPMPAPSKEAGGDSRADAESSFTALLETQVSFSELLELPAAIPVSADFGGGDLLPADGKNLPFTTALASLPVQRELNTGDGAAPVDPAVITRIELDLNLVYPATDVPPVTLLPQEIATVPMPLPGIPVSGTKVPGTPIAATENPVANEKPLPPPELLQPARHWAESAEWAAQRADARQIVGNAVQALHYKAARSAAEAATVAIPVADGDVPLQEIPVAMPLTRAVAAFETMRQADTRIAGSRGAVAATATHIAATLSQFSGEAAIPRDETLTAPIATPVRDNAWGEKLGERVMLLAGNQIKTADIRLTPADLGPLRIQLSIDDGVANVTFHAQHAVTREAIEQALPRLREMLSESGLSLGQANVSDRGTSGEHAKDSGSRSLETLGQVDDLSDPMMDHDAPMRRKSVSIDGLIDTFA